MSGRIRVEVDPDLADYIPQYIENRRQDLQQVDSALARGELDAVGAIGHRIRGSAASYGFEGLGELAARLETAAKAGDAAVARELVSEMGDYLSRVDVVTQAA